MPERDRAATGTWSTSPAEAAGLRAAFEQELAREADPHRRRSMSEGLALGLARVRAEREGTRLPEDVAARHVVAEQMVLAPWRRAHGLDGIEHLVVSGGPLDDDLEAFLRAVGLPAPRTTAPAGSAP